MLSRLSSLVEETEKFWGKERTIDIKHFRNRDPSRIKRKIA